MKIQILSYQLFFHKSVKDAFGNTDPICYTFIYNMTFINDVFIFQVGHPPLYFTFSVCLFFPFFFLILIFWTVTGVKGQKMAQNEK